MMDKTHQVLAAGRRRYRRLPAAPYGRPDWAKKCGSGASLGTGSAQVIQVPPGQRAEGTGCSRGGASSDRNLNYVVTQALGSLGPSFPAQPDLLKLDLGSVSREDGGKPRLVSLPRPRGAEGKAEEVGNDGRKADSKKGARRLVCSPSSALPCCSPRPAGEGAGRGVGCSVHSSSLPRLLFTTPVAPSPTQF